MQSRENSLADRITPLLSHDLTFVYFVTDFAGDIAKKPLRSCPLETLRVSACLSVSITHSHSLTHCPLEALARG